MTDRQAPRVFVTYIDDSETHKEQVLEFATFLRSKMGLDVHMNLWYSNIRRDWTLWAIEHLSKAEFILVIASPEYKRVADGTAPPDEGRRSQFEAAIIRDNITRNLRHETARVLPVVLPGRSIDEIPTFLNAHSTTQYTIREFTAEGVRELLDAITGHGQYPLPDRAEFVWRSGTRNTPRTVLLASGLRWLFSSRDTRRGVAQIDGKHYGDSIILRPSVFTAEPRGFVEFDLARAYRRFTSVVGVLDDAVEAAQKGYFRVLRDGSPEPVTSAALGEPGWIDLDVTGVLRLRLEMYRQGTVHSPLLAGALMASGGSSKLPELAWGDPALTA